MSAPRSCPPLEDPVTPVELPARPTRVGAAFPEPPPRLDRLWSQLERPFLALDHVLSALPEAWNPLSRAGAIANTALAVAVVTGVLLLFWYVPSVVQAWDSVQAMGGRSLPGLLRSLHRYSSDAAMFCALVHALRIVGERRFGGARWLAWITGLALVGLLWAVGWTGYWLVWDARAQAVAKSTAALADLLPVFSEPLSRSFLVDQTVSSLLFFVVFFVHMLVPLAAGVALWLHITRLARPRFLTDLPLTLWVLGSLVLLSLLWPADLAPRAAMADFGAGVSLDAWYLLPLWLAERLSGGVLWAILLFGGLILYSVPWSLGRRRAAPAVVEPARCNACETCYKDCPYDAIAMVPRTDGRPFDTVALVDPSRCVGCGICVGSCDTLAITPERLGAMPMRRAVGRQSAENPGEWFLFACARSAAAELTVAPGTGRCEALPGWRVQSLPCAGWLHPWVVGRALKGGAAGVVILSCTPASCPWREGEAWTAQRLAGLREPELEPAHRSRVHLLRMDRAQGPDLAARLDAVRRSAPATVGRRRLPVALVSTAATLALVGLGSVVPHAPPARDPELVISFVHPGEKGEDCHTLSEEEKAKLPVHMRQDRVCERRRADVRLQVWVDGQQALSRSYAPHGIWGDGSSVALERLPLSPGEHRVKVDLSDRLDQNSWPFQDERVVQVEAGRDIVLGFGKDRGFEWSEGSR